MCFSSEISFAASGVLFPLGIYSLVSAYKADKRYLLFSIIPIIFSIHQFIEGVIWNKLQMAPDMTGHQSVLAYTFIAFFIWPIYIPLSIYFIETIPYRRYIIAGMFFAGLLLSFVIYIPILTGTATIDVTIVNHALSYPVNQPLYQQKIYIVCYVFIILFPLFVCSKKEIKRFGILLFMALLLSYMWFYFALTSTWCFFSALLSLYIVYFLSRLDREI